MEIDIAVLADAANITTEGKLNITGIFDQITASVFPTVWPSCTLIIRLVGHQSETGEHKINVRIADEDGKELSRLNGEIKLNRKRNVSSVRSLQAPLIFNIVNLQLPRPGTYTFDVLIDGRFEVGVPLHVEEAGGQG